MKANHTPGPWKVMPCPIHKGKHILQDHRWIATENANVEYSPYVKNDWGLSSGSLICKMRDTTPYDAKLIAAAPDLYFGCRAALLTLEEDENYHKYTDIINTLKQAIRKAGD